MSPAHGTARRRRRFSTLHTVALAAILALAAFLRFYDLGEESLWEDELMSLTFVSAEGARGVVEFVDTSDVHPPLYYLVLHYSRALFGESEAALRLPSVVAGLLAVGVVYLLGRRLYSRAEGLAAALLVAVAWWPIYYSQDARSYSFLLLLSALSAFFWWGCFGRLKERPGRFPPWEAVGYVACAAALCYTHYFGVLLVALQGAALLALAPRSALRTALLYGAVGLLYLPWIPKLFSDSGGEAWFGRPRISFLEEFVTDVFGRSLLLTILCTFLLALGAQRAWARGGGPLSGGPNSRGLSGLLGRLLPGGLLIAWFAVPVLLAFAISLAWTPIFYPRNLTICLPAAFLLLARSLVLLSGRFWPTSTSALAVLFLAQLVFGIGYYERLDKEQFRATARYAASYAGPETAFVHSGWGGWYEERYPDRFDYYFEHFGAPEGPGQAVDSPQDVQAALKRFEAEGKSRLVYVRAHVDKPPVRRALVKEFGPPTKRGQFSDPNAPRVLVFEKR